jgi:hypothetical protein
MKVYPYCCIVFLKNKKVMKYRRVERPRALLDYCVRKGYDVLYMNVYDRNTKDYNCRLYT